VLDVLYHRAKFGWPRISPAAGAAKNVWAVCLCLFVCVCLLVTVLNVRVCAPDFAMKALEYKNDFDGEKVCSCAPFSTFSDCRQLATPHNAEVQKTAKLAVFCCQTAIKWTDRNEIDGMKIFIDSIYRNLPTPRVMEAASRSASWVVSSVFRKNLFSHKAAIVTGGGTGIGRAITQELLYLGCRL